MKQNITKKQIQELNALQIDRLTAWCNRHDYGRLLFIGQMIELIRVTNQITIYTVDDYWKVQLFDPEVAANDLVDCIWEDGAEELCDALWKAVEHILNDFD